MPEDQDGIDWRDMLVAFLHDPPDKALDIRGHEARAKRYLEAALQTTIGDKEIKIPADVDAAIAERLPMPTAGASGKRAVGPENGLMQIVHPLSADAIELTVEDIQKDVVLQTIESLVNDLETNQQRFLAIWRKLPECLAEKDSFFALLPADTRIPDHSIWNHLDITAALKEQASAKGIAFLSFSLNPVQEFIAAAHSIRDLWSGSMLLSWITFHGMKPIIEKCGPTALVYPSLRGLPWLDEFWLRETVGLKAAITRPSEEELAVPCIPNRFLAVVPAHMAENIAQACKDSARNAWFQVADKIKNHLDERYTQLPYGGSWAKRWDEQLKAYFGITVSFFLKRDLHKIEIEDILGKKIAPKARDLAELLPKEHRPGYPQNSAGDWQAMVEYSAKLLNAFRSIKHVPLMPQRSSYDRFPKKCSLLGSFEQMGPDDLNESRQFWESASAQDIHGIRLRKNERLCAVSLVKRFCGRLFFKEKLKLTNDRFFEDTATVAAKIWMDRVGIDPQKYDKWNGQWLHWMKQETTDNEDPVPDELWKKIKTLRQNAGNGHGAAPTYYAVLMLDGDDMGQWLAGEKAPLISEILHPKIKAYYENLNSRAGDCIKSKRPVGPAMHAAISQALANFAVYAVPVIVQKHKGTLIYSGGDDVLALLPLETVMPCALELYSAFRGEINDGSMPGFYTSGKKQLLMMGPKATLSGGLAVVHYKYDLRSALQQARDAEKVSKKKGKNLLSLALCRRSGQHQMILTPWDEIPKFFKFYRAFCNGASDRFAYHLAEKCETLIKLPLAVQKSQISFYMQRAESETRKLLTGFSDKKKSGEQLIEWFEDYSRSLQRYKLDDSSAMQQFVWFIQAASFMARGREV